MRSFVSVMVGGALALALAGCDPVTDKHYFTKGIGTELYTSSISEKSNELEIYIHETCQQAGLVYSHDGECLPLTKMDRAATWTLFVQAGMNDIDRRCDGYLVWLDNIRRSEAPRLKQLGDTNIATQLVLTTTNAGVVPMALVATAFGFAADTLTNVNSRLILTVNHSTVQAVVLGRQKEYRKDLLGDGNSKPKVIIDNRPAAVHALRNYMRLCMPMTIETEINNTIVAYERGGIEALRAEKMITAMSVSQPVTAAQTLIRPIRKFEPTDEYAQFFEEKLSKTEAQKVLNGLCLNKNSTPDMTKAEVIASLVAIFEQSRDSDIKPVPDGKISRRERPFIANQTDCGDAKNFFERKAYANSVTTGADNAGALAWFVKNRLVRSPDTEPVPDPITLTNLRKKIQAARVALKLEDVQAPMNDQITRQLDLALARLPRPQTPPATQPPATQSGTQPPATQQGEQSPAAQPPAPPAR